VGCLLALRRAGLGLTILLAASMAGCAETDTDRTPAELLSIASAGLEGVDRYTFRSRTTVRSGGIILHELESYEGEIAGHAVRAIRSLSDGPAPAADEAETPASRLAELASPDAEIAYAGEAPEGCVALVVKLPADAATRDIGNRLTRQFELAADMAASGLADGVLRSGDGAEASAFRRALADETASFRRELDRLLAGLEAETTATVTIDRRTMLPVALEEKSVLKYEAGGRTRTEEWVTRTTLDGFDGRPSSS